MLEYLQQELDKTDYPNKYLWVHFMRKTILDDRRMWSDVRCTKYANIGILAASLQRRTGCEKLFLPDIWVMLTGFSVNIALSGVCGRRKWVLEHILRKWRLCHYMWERWNVLSDTSVHKKIVQKPWNTLRVYLYAQKDCAKTMKYPSGIPLCTKKLCKNHEIPFGYTSMHRKHVQ